MQILLADDHAMVREALLPFIMKVADDITVIEAENLHEAIQLAEGTDELGLIILDLKMPGMEDVKGLKQIHSLFPDVPKVILSGTINVRTIMRTIENGAAGFIPKTYDGQSLISALRLILSGERYIPSSILINDENSQFSLGDRNTISIDRILTASEQETLNLLKEGNSNKEIARALGVQEVTIKKRLARIYRKLDVSNRTQATRAFLKLNPED